MGSALLTVRWLRNRKSPYLPLFHSLGFRSVAFLWYFFPQEISALQSDLFSSPLRFNIPKNILTTRSFALKEATQKNVLMCDENL